MRFLSPERLEPGSICHSQLDSIRLLSMVHRRQNSTTAENRQNLPRFQP